MTQVWPFLSLCLFALGLAKIRVVQTATMLHQLKIDLRLFGIPHEDFQSHRNIEFSDKTLNFKVCWILSDPQWVPRSNTPNFDSKVESHHINVGLGAAHFWVFHLSCHYVEQKCSIFHILNMNAAADNELFGLQF